MSIFCVSCIMTPFLYINSWKLRFHVSCIPPLRASHHCACPTVRPAVVREPLLTSCCACPVVPVPLRASRCARPVARPIARVQLFQIISKVFIHFWIQYSEYLNKNKGRAQWGMHNGGTRAILMIHEIPIFKSLYREIDSCDSSVCHRGTGYWKSWYMMLRKYTEGPKFYC